MAITDKKGINVTSGFKLISPSPIDARFVVETEKELQSIIDNGAAYNGLEVWVNSLEKKKQYNGTDFVDVQEDTIVNSFDLLEEDAKNFKEESEVAFYEEGILEPLSGTVYDLYLYLNNKLSVKEVVDILETLEWEDMGGGYYKYEFLSGRAGRSTVSISIIKDNGKYSIDIYSERIWDSENGFSNTVNDFYYSYKSQIDMYTWGEQNNKLIKLFSFVPYYYEKRNFDYTGTAIGNAGKLSQVYVNTKIWNSTAQLEIFNKLNFFEFPSGYDSTLFPKEGTLTYIIACDSSSINSLKNAIFLIKDKERPNYFSLFIRKNSSITQKKLCARQNFSSFSISISSLSRNLESYPSGKQNDILSSLISTSYFKKESKSKKQLYFYHNKPFSRKESLYIRSVYLNTNLSSNEVVSIIVNANLPFVESYNGKEESYTVLNMGTSSSSIIIIHSLDYDTYSIYASGETVFSSGYSGGWSEDFNGELQYNKFSEGLTSKYENKNNELGMLFSLEPFSKVDTIDISSQLYKEDTENNGLKELYPITKVENLRTSKGDKYKLSNVTFGQKTEKIQQKVCTTDNYSYSTTLYFNTSLSVDTIRDYILNDTSLDWGEYVEINQSTGGNDPYSSPYNDPYSSPYNDPYSSPSGSGSDNFVTSYWDYNSVIVYNRQFTNDNGENIQTKIRIRKINEECFIELETYNQTTNQKTLELIFSSNSAYGGFEGWEYNHYGVAEIGINSSNNNDFTDSSKLTQIISFAPFNFVIEESERIVENGLFLTKENGEPNLNKPISNFVVNNKIPIIGNVSRKLNWYVDYSLSVASVVKILERLGLTSSNSRYATNFGVSVELIEEGVYTISHYNTTIFSNIVNGGYYGWNISEINKEGYSLENSSGEFPIENGLLVELFYTTSQNNIIFMDSNGIKSYEKPISGIACNGKIFPLKNSLDYEEVE